jgi:carboxyl-terminal processing protease
MWKIMWKKSAKAVLVLVISLCILLSGVGVYASSDEYQDLGYLESIMDMIKEKYRGEITDSQLIEGALKGMFNTMDPYTTYFTSEEADSFFDEMSGSYEGVGISMEKQGDYITVIKVFPLSPAEKSGIMMGDKIAAVNGKNVVGASIDEAASLIRGPAGTKVTIGIIRQGLSGVLNIEVQRAKIKLNPVLHEIRDDIGYIKIETFNANASEYVSEALQEMDKNNIKKIILDLRNNPGGEVKQAVSIAGNFVPKGLITKLDFKSESDSDEEYYSRLEKVKYKLAVLVNGTAASASEILAGAIQDTGAGKLIGTKTFGKAKVQTLIPLLTPESYKKYKAQLGERIVSVHDLIGKHNIIPSDDEINGWTKITTAVYLTPKGRMIDGKGLTPNVWIDDPKPVSGIDILNIQKLTKASKPDLGSEGMDVYNAEKILKLLGYDVDTPDMKLDKKTFDAIWKFRVDNKLYPGGVLDFTTQDKLNSKLHDMLFELDKQYAKAVEYLSE